VPDGSDDLKVALALAGADATSGVARPALQYARAMQRTGAARQAAAFLRQVAALLPDSGPGKTLVDKELAQFERVDSSQSQAQEALRQGLLSAEATLGLNSRGGGGWTATCANQAASPTRCSC
jgi:hypothetical protein